MNGLYLDLDSFKKLPAKEQMAVLYENQVKTLDLLRAYETQVKAVKFRQQIQWAWLGGLTAVGIWLINLVINK